MIVEIEFYTKAKCGLCDKAMALLEPIAKEEGATIRKVDIEADPALKERFGTLIPVIAIDGNVLFTYRVDPEQARKHIRRARATANAGRGNR